MTERDSSTVVTEEAHFAVGPSSMTWDGTALTVEIDERAVPHLTGIKGRIRVIPGAVTDREVALHEAHVWRPFAPSSRIEVRFERPGLDWVGHGYLDANFGRRALEHDFRYWTWGRYEDGAEARTFYDLSDRAGKDLNVALRFTPDGAVHEIDAPPKAPLRRTLWRVDRETRGERPRELMRMEDAPFYARAAVETGVDGRRITGVHEALDLDRFAARWVKMLLPWRMPRARGPLRRFF